MIASGTARKNAPFDALIGKLNGAANLGTKCAYVNNNNGGHNENLVVDMGTYLLLRTCVLKTWKGPPPNGMVLLYCVFLLQLIYYYLLYVAKSLRVSLKPLTVSASLCVPFFSHAKYLMF